MTYLRQLIDKCSQKELDDLKLRELILEAQRLCPTYEEEYLNKYPKKTKEDAIRYADKKFRRLYKEDFEKLFKNKLTLK